MSKFRSVGQIEKQRLIVYHLFEDYLFAFTTIYFLWHWMHKKEQKDDANTALTCKKNVAVYAAVPLYWHWLILHQSYATTKSCAQSSNDRLEMYCDFIWSKSIASHLWNAQLALTREGFVWKEESRSISWLRVKSKLDSQVSLPCTSALATFAIESQTNA